MIRLPLLWLSAFRTCPHTRGDDPGQSLGFRCIRKLVPPRVGMIPSRNSLLLAAATCPHTRGDDPMWSIASARKANLSPRMWGQVVGALAQAKKVGIIPIHVVTRTVNVYVSSIGVNHSHACGNKSRK